MGVADQGRVDRSLDDERVAVRYFALQIDAGADGHACADAARGRPGLGGAIRRAPGRGNWRYLVQAAGGLVAGADGADARRAQGRRLVALVDPGRRDVRRAGRRVLRRRAVGAPRPAREGPLLGNHRPAAEKPKDLWPR